jgi:hypothetical protein
LTLKFRDGIIKSSSLPLRSSSEKLAQKQGIQEELNKVSELINLHEQNVNLLRSYELQLVQFYQKLLTSPNENQDLLKPLMPLPAPI